MRKYIIEKDWVYEGKRCVVVISNEIGHRCGYVGVEKGHILYGKEYSKHIPKLKKKLQWLKEQPVGKRGVISLLTWDGKSVSIDMLFNVHGGVTFTNGGKNSDYPVESNLWWIGYDCGHHMDAPDPKYANPKYRLFKNTGTVRTLNYCIKECQSLVDQINSLE